jgi:lipoprotein-anchoring transpeptidase ErfK/SrfK
VTYTVQEGDTLWGISLIFGVTVAQIVQKNNLQSDSWIIPGQVLIIPKSGEVLPTVEATNKHIVVILSQQKVYAYEGDVLIRDFVVSTGVAEHPTVQGTFNIYVKLESTRMTGEGYDLPNVLWTMYFYEGYSFHGTYWHSNFGHPMSHGCVNMKTEDALWLFNWALVGTRVDVLP